MEIKELEEETEKLTRLADSYQKNVEKLPKNQQLDPTFKQDIKWLRNQIKENLAKISIMKDESRVYE